MRSDPLIHPTAEIDPSVHIGENSKVWHFAQVRKGVVIGSHCILGRGVYIDENIIIGNFVKIQNRSSIYKYCTIEDGVFIGPHVVFTNDSNPRAINLDGSLKAADDWHAGSSRVHYGASIGASSVILPNRVIGKFSLIGAGSVVTRDVSDYAIVAGNPARIRGYACACGKVLDISSPSVSCHVCHSSYSLHRQVNGAISVSMNVKDN